MRPNIEPILTAFVSVMRQKLNENEHKESWRDEEIHDLHQKLKIEMHELDVEIRKDGSSSKITRECADVANFALMIADKCNGLDETILDREAVTIKLLQHEILRLEVEVEKERTRWRIAAERHDKERSRRQELEKTDD